MIKETVYKSLPNVFQNLLITLFDILQYRRRHASGYFKYKEYLNSVDKLSRHELKAIQNEKLVDYLTYCKLHSPYFKKILKDIDVTKGLDCLKEMPICDKEAFRKNIPSMITGNKSDMYGAKTGGTTGTAMQIYFRWDDVAERFAFLDVFRERFGYKFGERTAWLSGKDILTKRDLRKNRFWKQDWAYNIRYYATFNINDKTIPFYIKDLQKYQPKFIVGFPSSIVEIAKYGISRNIDLGYKVSAIFPTAETKVTEEAKTITSFFGGGVYDQYASSEGACFITECEAGSLHFELLSGVIEVVDDEGNPAEEGRMLITAFHTRGTPLIRYDIGDRMKWSDRKSCTCGRETPIVEEIQGRINDYIYSRETGKCNLGNISNSIKYVNGVKKFQVVQNEIDKIRVIVEKDGDVYSDEDEQLFLSELVYRLGESMIITFEYVDIIPREKSGKFRIVKNHIKDEVEKLSKT